MFIPITEHKKYCNSCTHKLVQPKYNLVIKYIHFCSCHSSLNTFIEKLKGHTKHIALNKFMYTDMKVINWVILLRITLTFNLRSFREFVRLFLFD